MKTAFPLFSFQTSEEIPYLSGVKTCNSTRTRLVHISLGPGLGTAKAGGKYLCEGSSDVVQLPCWRKTVSGLKVSFSLVIWYGRAEHVVQEYKLILVSKSSLANT